MADHSCDYLIVGAGLAGASAVEGIRERDPKRSITMIGAEKHLPYDRPPLSKKLRFGKKKVKDIFLHDRAFYNQKGVTLFAGRHVVALDVKNKTVTDMRSKFISTVRTFRWRQWLVVAMFVSSLGPWINMTSGIADYPWRRFILWDVLGQVLWVVLFVMLGYIFSERVQVVAEVLGRLAWVGLGVILADILGLRIMQYLRPQNL